MCVVIPGRRYGTVRNPTVGAVEDNDEALERIADVDAVGPGGLEDGCERANDSEIAASNC